MSNPYQYWEDALAGLKPRCFVDSPELGFFRKGVYERNENGNNRRVGWTPVAIYMAGGEITAQVGDNIILTDRDRINELWSYCAANPISEGTYRMVAEDGKPWPDAHDPKKNIEPTVKSGDATPSPKAFPELKIDAESPELKLAREIAEAKAGVSQYDKIESDEMAGRALSLKNEITTLAGKLDKIRESLVRPHVDAQAEINGRFNPIIKDAKTEGAKLMQRIGIWEDTKRIAAREAQARADKLAHEHAERVRKAEEAGKPAPAAPKPVAPNAPPPSTQVAAAVGRKASVKVAKFVTDIDLDKAFAQFRNEPAVRATLIALAQKAIDAGLSVDGATVEERSVVR